MQGNPKANKIGLKTDPAWEYRGKLDYELRMQPEVGSKVGLAEAWREFGWMTDSDGEDG